MRGFSLSAHDNLHLNLFLSYVFSPIPPELGVEISEIHMGWEDACALEETGEFQAGAAKRYTSERGDCPRAEGRGQKLESLRAKQMKYGKYGNQYIKVFMTDST